MTTAFLWDADATQDINLWSSSVSDGSFPSIVTDFKNGGHGHSLKLKDPGGIGIGVDYSGVSISGGRVSLYGYFNALPSSSNSMFFWGDLANDTGNEDFKLRVDNVGVIRAFRQDGTQLGSDGSVAIASGTWARLSVAWKISSTTVNDIRVWLNHTLIISITNATLNHATMAHFSVETNGDTTVDFRVSDVMIDDSNALTDIATDVWVTSKRPVANGSLNEWTTQIGAGGSGYGAGHSPQVNELPLSTTNGWSFQNAAKKTEEYTVEGASVGQIDITGAAIIDWVGWVYAKVGSASTGNIIVGGTATNKSLTTSYAAYQQAKGSTTYPAGNTDVGMDTNTVNQLFSLAECGVMVAYTPAVAPAFTGNPYQTVQNLSNW